MACKPPNFACIVAATAEKWGIGIENRLPWKIKRDMNFFVQVTKRVIIDHDVVMGRRNWESIPPKYQPLKQRLNVVLSRTWKVPPSPPISIDRQSNNSNTESSLAQDLPPLSLSSSPPILLFNDFSTAIDNLSANPQVSRIYIIGGLAVYAEAMTSPLCTHILLTRIYKEFESDTFLPPIDETVYQQTTHEELVNFVGMDVPKGVQEENEIPFEFLMNLIDISNTHLTERLQQQDAIDRANEYKDLISSIKLDEKALKKLQEKSSTLPKLQQKTISSTTIASQSPPASNNNTRATSPGAILSENSLTKNDVEWLSKAMNEIHDAINHIEVQFMGDLVVPLTWNAPSPVHPAHG
ncbi:2369_t:CDS:2 [Ambispora gerdemannii]|uniref:Dihydrofolate reductase n=1 Tax=Ambispora gerdemannii TaxID=144530 RepID=A0A9N9AVG8_9GLOM|nr:2369_t:CDS:2 [Ambispora gerdemannii]